MTQIAVIEDDYPDFQHLAKICQQYFEKTKEPYEITHYRNAEDFLNSYHLQFQLIFMDIELPNTNGMTAAHKLRALDPDVVLVFLTNLSQYAVSGYEVNAVDYILKPISYYAFSLKMPRIMQYVYKNTKHNLLISLKDSSVMVAVSDIYYVEIVSHKLIYHTVFENISVRGSLHETESLLAPYHFRRCNNCYLVNLKHVKGIFSNEVQVGPDRLAISRPRKKAFINDLTNYNGGTLI